MFSFPLITSAGDLHIGYGLGVFNSSLRSKVEVKSLIGGAQFSLAGPFRLQTEIGAWKDERYDLGRKNSAFANISPGLRVNAGYLYVQMFTGAAFLAQKDSLLGGHFQFNHDLGLGIQDPSWAALGLNYKHMSSAGIFKPNYGRDLIYVRLSFPW